jgi:hypothetical protein
MPVLVFRFRFSSIVFDRFGTSVVYLYYCLLDDTKS